VKPAARTEPSPLPEGAKVEIVKDKPEKPKKGWWNRLSS
jgi:hypothetical protein